MRFRERGLALLLLLLCLHAIPCGATFLYDPALRFRTLTTEHFVVYFHQGEERAAARLSAIAEDTWQRLQRPFDVMPPGRTAVVLVDQTESANGSATPLPRDTIVVTAAAPAGSEFIGKTDDWLRMVFTHEFTHIVHLDRSQGWARGVRSVFGRVPIAFPNLFLPLWQIEGLATYEESRLTGEGRLHAGDFQAVTGEAAAAHRMEPLDRANGGLTTWPDGLNAYAYGLGFQAFLADRYGEDTIAKMAGQTAGRFPFVQSPVFKRVYGKSLGDLWKEYEAATMSGAEPAAGADTIPRLTHHGYVVAGPRFAPPRCSGCPEEIVYSVRTPDGFPSLNSVGLDGTSQHELASRYLGATSGVSPALVVFDQQEIRHNVGLHSDLYALDRASGSVHRLTSGARLLDPDLSPDGRTIAAAREGNGQRALVLIQLSPAGGQRTPGARDSPDVTGITTLVAEADTQFNAPRWSPDGRRLVVERHRLGALSESVIVDVATAAVTVLASREGARIVTPTWRPDGRAVVASVALDDGPFNLYEFALDRPGEGRPLTAFTGGATWPDVSADGSTVVFVGYRSDGFDLYTIPYPGAGGAQPVAFAAGSGDAATPIAASRDDDIAPPVSRAYSPWPTLAPTSWEPVIAADGDQVRAGVSTGGFDVLGYHAYAAWATWLLSGPTHAELPARSAPDWQLSYAYARWRPIFFLTASSQTSFFAGPPTLAGTPSNATLQEREVEGGVSLPFHHVHHTHAVFASLFRSADHYTFGGQRAGLTRGAARAGWMSTTAHTYGYSISPEGGVTVGATAEFTRTALGSSGNSATPTFDARVYLPGFASHHVLAVRAGGGASGGDRDVRRTFLLGGPDVGADVISFSSDAFRLLRAFPSASFAGTRIGVVNAEYRFPIRRVERGAGTWPLFLHTVHAAIFADAGHAWTTAFHAGDIKTSVGAELSANLVAGYTFPFTATWGGAWGRDGASGASNATAYIRIGRSF